ncbi:MAG: toxin-antitoxin system YwqK family antitoxin [Verrucomicrobia bacterium]|nr:toxin-antitoxin system YwqK family antitoxin [Verrucomicrobiota bacterium]
MSRQISRTRRRALNLIAALVAILIALLITIRRERAPSGSPTSASPRSVARTNLVLVSGRLCLVGQTNGFTGLMEERGDGFLRSRSVLSNGVLHGLSEGWHTNGQLQVREYFREGVSHGTRTKWYPEGRKLSEASIVEGKLEGPFRRWHENGALSEQIEFVADQPDGVSISDFPSGFLKARVVMKTGKLVEQTFWKDGERKP